jgi:hypothetical protein
LLGTLTATDGAVTPVEYHFVRENSEWKILGFGIQRPGLTTTNNHQESTTADSSQGEIYQVLVSDTFKPGGNVEQTKSIIPHTAPKIFTSVYILHAKAGVKVFAELVRLENGAKIGPSEATISQDGNIVRNFSFTNTESSWPLGDIVINVTTSNNQKATVKLTIN